MSGDRPNYSKEVSLLLIASNASVREIEDVSIQSFVRARTRDMALDEPYDPDLYGPVIVLEPGDTANQLAEAAGFDVLTQEVPFEVLDDHPSCYELVIVPGDGDFGIVIYIPKLEGVCPELLAFCQAHATP